MSSCRLNGGARYENKIGTDLLLAVRVSPRVRRSSIPHTHTHTRPTSLARDRRRGFGDSSQICNNKVESTSSCNSQPITTHK